MIDKDNILKDGYLDRYLLGELSKDEERGVCHILDTDPELRAAFSNLEATFEKIGQENAINPPIQVKSQLLSGLSPVKTRSLVSKPSYKTHFAIAASIAAMFCLGFLWMYSQFSATKSDLELVKEQNESLQNEFNGLAENYSAISLLLNMINDPESEPYLMVGNDLAPNAKVVSYVNHSNKSVVVNTSNLPKLDDTHDYQMWADVDGEMINMGVLEKNKNLIEVAYIDKAESLNITIEPAGGNDHPTVSQLLTSVTLR